MHSKFREFTVVIASVIGLMSAFLSFTLLEMPEPLNSFRNDFYPHTQIEKGSLVTIVFQDYPPGSGKIMTCPAICSKVLSDDCVAIEGFVFEMDNYLDPCIISVRGLLKLDKNAFADGSTVNVNDFFELDLTRSRFIRDILTDYSWE